MNHVLLAGSRRTLLLHMLHAAADADGRTLRVHTPDVSTFLREMT